MTEKSNTEGQMRDEFRNLGENLKAIVNAAWESEERRKIQHEVEEGINELGQAVNELINKFQTSDVAEKVSEGVDQIGAQIRSGEAETKVRDGLVTALQTFNAELQKAAGKFSSEEDEEA